MRMGRHPTEWRALYEKMLGPEHPQTAAALSNLGSIYQAKGGRKKAVELYARALAIDEKTLGPESSSTTAIRDNIKNEPICEYLA